MVPEPCRCQTTASSGFPASASNAVTAPIEITNTPSAVAATTAHRRLLHGHTHPGAGAASPFSGIVPMIWVSVPSGET